MKIPQLWPPEFLKNTFHPWIPTRFCCAFKVRARSPKTIGPRPRTTSKSMPMAGNGVKISEKTWGSRRVTQLLGLPHRGSRWKWWGWWGSLVGLDKKAQVELKMSKEMLQKHVEEGGVTGNRGVNMSVYKSILYIYILGKLCTNDPANFICRSFSLRNISIWKTSKMWTSIKFLKHTTSR